MKFVFVLAIFIVCAAAVTIHQVKNTRQCKAEGGICKQTCAVDEEDTGPCCRHSYRCCQTPTCNDSLQYAQCKAKHGESKPVCNVNEQDTGIGPFCNGNRCCEPPTCNTKVDCNCKSPGFRCPLINEYLDIAGNCSGSNTCCKPCCLTCGGTFNGPEGIFTSTHYPSKYCYNQICRYTIKVEEGSKKKIFSYFKPNPNSSDSRSEGTGSDEHTSTKIDDSRSEGTGSDHEHTSTKIDDSSTPSITDSSTPSSSNHPPYPDIENTGHKIRKATRKTQSKL
ncbi:unnamed protein product [Mytilus edulis]|uniref:CUB domain-containing protein n=1 Tax=Mytilus edulis TaxID=6550 RepID=A0A8S3S6X0_MYTED|nr:unnamed protein product [Mytilus edulis]